MKNIINLLIISILVISKSFGQLYSTQTGETNFFSETPLENISAVNKKTGAIINTATNEVVVSMRMNAFEFPNKLMQEHFNENYMESEKFPSGIFKGKIIDAVNFTKMGTYDVTAKGQLTIHGVTQNRDLKGKLIVENGSVTFESNFDVKLVDHKIEVPTLVFAKIAETITVKTKYSLILKDKK
jgi:YceI-like domain